MGELRLPGEESVGAAGTECPINGTVKKRLQLFVWDIDGRGLLPELLPGADTRK